MNELYKLVLIGKEKQKLESDRGYAIKNDIHPQVIADLKSGKSNLNGPNMLKILKAAGLSVDDGLTVIEKQKKQAGYADIGLITLMGGLSLVGVSPTLEAATGAGLLGISYALYIMRNDGTVEIRLCGKVKTHLNSTPLHQYNHLVPANDAIAA